MPVGDLFVTHKGILTKGTHCDIIRVMKYYSWNEEKNDLLKKTRGICFEQIVMHIERGDLLDILPHPNLGKYPNQKIMIVNVNEYIFIVPFVEDEKDTFLKTIIPSRKLTKKYLR